MVLRLRELLSRNVHYKGVNTKHSDFVLSSSDTSIEVAVLSLTLCCAPLLLAL